MAITKIDLTDVDDVLTNNILRHMELTSYTSPTVPILEAGRSEEIGGELYQVTSGNHTPTGSPSDGVVYVYIEDLGASITCTLSNTAPTWTGHGWYNGNAKAVFKCDLASTVYTKKEYMTYETEDIRPALLEIVSIDEDTIFDALIPYCPVDGELYPITGYIQVGAADYRPFYRCVTSGSTITLHTTRGVNYTVTDGNVSNIPTAITLRLLITLG